MGAGVFPQSMYPPYPSRPKAIGQPKPLRLGQDLTMWEDYAILKSLESELLSSAPCGGWASKPLLIET